MNRWKRVCIEQACESIVDCINKTAPIIDEPSQFKMIRTTNIRNGRVNLESVRCVSEETYYQWTRRQIPRRGDILLTREAPMGEVGMLLTDDYVFLGQRIVSYRTDLNQLNNEFLLYAFQSNDLQNQIKAFASGSTVQHMRVPDTKALQIPLPSLAEQKRIVAILDEAFEGIDRAITNTEKNLTNSRELFESYLNEIFTQKGNGWEWVSLSDITTDITDGDHQPPPKSQSGIPFITISNINKQDRKVDFSNTFKVSPEYFEKLKDNRKPRKDDLLYTVTGSYGIPVVVDHDMNFCFQRHIGLIRPNNETNSKCLYYMLLSRHLLNQADECATGTAQKTVSLSGLRRFSVPKIPKAKQEIIVAELDILSDQICRLEDIYHQKLAALNELKQSILQKAFTGELTADTANQTIEAAEEEIAA